MFDSGISAQSLIDELYNEIDLPYEFRTNEKNELVTSLNTIEKIIYKNIIRHVEMVQVSLVDNSVSLVDINTAIGNSFENIDASDIVKCEEVISGKTFTRTTLDKFNAISGTYIFSNGYFSINPDKVFNTTTQLYETPVVENINIYFVACPPRKVITTINDVDTINGNVMIPYEFIPMIKSYIRGEQYKILNEDDIAQKWIADFNSQIENFKQFISSI